MYLSRVKPDIAAFSSEEIAIVEAIAKSCPILTFMIQDWPHGWTVTCNGIPVRYAKDWSRRFDDAIPPVRRPYW